MGESKLRTSVLCAILIFTIFLSIVDISSAAIIHGSVYNIILEKASNVRLEINTQPKQVMISKDGDYTFNVPKGEYTITAAAENSYAEENISVLDDGDYIIDIVLAPLIGQSIENIDEYNVSTQEPASSTNYLPLTIGIILLIGLSIIIFLLFVRKQSFGINKKNKEHSATDSENLSSRISHPHVSSQTLDKNAQKALDFIKHNTHTTQKDLRKQLPLSEAKISLIVAELEHEGKIKKIKKGRGNILVYVKD